MKKNFLIFFILSSFLIIILAQWILLPSHYPYNTNLIKSNLILILISIIVFLNFNEQELTLKGQSFRSIYLLIIGIFIVHYQIYIDFEFGNYIFFNRDFIIDTAVMKDGILISSAGLISMMIGYMSGILFLKKSINKKNTHINKKTPSITGLIGLIFFIGFLATTQKEFFIGGYSIIERNYLSEQFEMFLIISISSSFISSSYIIRKNEIKTGLKEFINKNSYINLTVTFLYLFLVITSGYRVPLISIGLLILGSFIYSQKIKIKPSTTILLMVIFSIFISSIALVREIKDENIINYLQYKLTQNIKNENDYSISKYTHELAISIRSWHTALIYVKEMDYKYGLIQLNQILSIIPGAGTLFRNIFDLSSEDLSSAIILTNHYKNHSGLGTTVIADVYMDFSIYGVILILFLLGLFARNLDLKSSSKSAPSLIIWICILILLSKSIFISRSAITIIFRDILLIYIEIILINNFLKKKLK